MEEVKGETARQVSKKLTKVTKKRSVIEELPLLKSTCCYNTEKVVRLTAHYAGRYLDAIHSNLKHL